MSDAVEYMYSVWSQKCLCVRYIFYITKAYFIGCNIAFLLVIISIGYYSTDNIW